MNQESFKSSVKLVCFLLKAPYGLKQAPRRWFFKLSTTLLDLEFKQSISDYSLFNKHTNISFIAVLVYVDDLLICESDTTQIADLKDMFSQSFHMKDLGQLKYFLGLELDKTTAGFFLSQHKYIKDLLSEFGLLAQYPISKCVFNYYFWPFLKKVII